MLVPWFGPTATPTVTTRASCGRTAGGTAEERIGPPTSCPGCVRAWTSSTSAADRARSHRGPGPTRAGRGQVVGVDNVDEVVDLARTTAADSGTANVRFAVGDAYHLAFPDGSFDVVHAHQILQHLSDRVGALAEMGRVCRRHGLVAARDGGLGGFHLVPRRSVARHLARHLRSGGPPQRRRARRRPAAAGVGPGGGIRPRRGHSVGVVLHRARRPALVG